MDDRINLVDEDGQRIGAIGKLEAHVEAKLHEAFSIFIFNSKKELLLQQRNKQKYHSGGLWSNTVCSHPAFGEKLEKAVQRRLLEEMGFSVPTKKIFSFVYKSEYENGLTEYEFDYVFVGRYDGEPVPNKEEVMDYEWITLNDIRKDIVKNPSNYTTWFRKILENDEFVGKIDKACKII